MRAHHQPHRLRVVAVAILFVAVALLADSALATGIMGFLLIAALGRWA